MILFYSGWSSLDYANPEWIIASKELGVMLTYHELYKDVSATKKRFKRHKKNKRKEQLNDKGK